MSLLPFERLRGHVNGFMVWPIRMSSRAQDFRGGMSWLRSVLWTSSVTKERESERCVGWWCRHSVQPNTWTNLSDLEHPRLSVRSPARMKDRIASGSGRQSRTVLVVLCCLLVLLTSFHNRGLYKERILLLGSMWVASIKSPLHLPQGETLDGNQQVACFVFYVFEISWAAWAFCFFTCGR